MSTNTLKRLLVLVLIGLVAVLVFVLVTEGATGDVVLRWTAPGDDGNLGRAAAYDVRYATDSITASTWETATQATGEPLPDSAGAPQSFTLQDLPSGVTFFAAVKARDEAFNWSGLSNVVRFVVPDTEAPAAVTDLEAVP